MSKCLERTRRDVSFLEKALSFLFLVPAVHPTWTLYIRKIVKNIKYINMGNKHRMHPSSPLILRGLLKLLNRIINSLSRKTELVVKCICSTTRSLRQKPSCAFYLLLLREPTTALCSMLRWYKIFSSQANYKSISIGHNKNPCQFL